MATMQQSDTAAPPAGWERLLAAAAWGYVGAHSVLPAWLVYAAALLPLGLIVLAVRRRLRSWLGVHLALLLGWWVALFLFLFGMAWYGNAHAVTFAALQAIFTGDPAVPGAIGQLNNALTSPEALTFYLLSYTGATRTVFLWSYVAMLASAAGALAGALVALLGGYRRKLPASPADNAGKIP
ncbi:MAG TPA: hypothetical protein PK794_11675 [Armatimonadota bacterium]|nr:hypothetical protein [Armatimonadota bacterium]